MKPFVLLFALFFVLSVDSQRTSGKRKAKQVRPNVEEPKLSKCTQQQDSQADAKVAQLISIITSRKIPETEREFTKYCRESRSSITFMDNYADNCLEPFTEQIVSTALFTIKKSVRNICKSGSFKSEMVQNLLKNAPCMNKARPGIKRCYSRFLDSLDGIVFAEGKQKVPLICCNWYKMKQCGFSALEKERCGSQVTEMAQNLIDENSSSIRNLVCRNVKENDPQCKTLVTPARDKRQRRSKSPVFPLLRIISTL